MANDLVSPKDVRALIADYIKLCGGKRPIVAEAFGVTQQHLSDMLNGRKLPGPKVLNVLGLRRHMMYEKIPPKKPRGKL